jgi:O-antigen ligase/Tfp pilus assembly protein PilF
MAKRGKHSKTLPAAPAGNKVSIISIAAYALALLGLFLAPVIAGRFDAVPNLAVQSIVFAAVFLWVLAPGKDGVRLPARLSLLSVILFTLLIASAVGTASRAASLSAVLNFGCYLCIFLMAVSLKGQREIVYGLLAALLLSAIIVGAIGLREYIPNLRAGAVTWRTFSTFFNPDYLAGFMVIMLPISLAWYLSKTSMGMTLISTLGVVFSGIALAVTGSRFGALAGVGGIFIFLLLAVRSRSMGRFQWTRIAPVLLVLILVLLFMGKPIISRVANVKTEAHSGNFRIYTWVGTARMSAAHPVFGTGLGTFEVAYPRHALVGYTALAHNSYLQLAAEAGIPAAFLLMLLAASAWIPLCAAAGKGSRNQDDDADCNSGGFAWMPDKNLMLCGVVAAAAASLMRNAVDSDWYVTAVGLSFWAVLGAGVAVSGGGKQGFCAIGRGARAAAAGVTGVMLFTSLLMLCAASKLEYGERALADGDAYAAVESLKQSAAINPISPEPHRLLGRIYSVTDTESPAYESRAVLEMKKAVQLEPSNAKGYYQLAKTYEREGRPMDAVRAYKEGLSRDPHSPQMLAALARAYDSAGMKADALDIWRRLAAQEETPYEQIKAIPELVAPEYIFAHAALGHEYERLGDRGSARLHYGKALGRIERYEASMQGMGQAWAAAAASAKETSLLVESVKEELNSRLPAAGLSGR